MTSLTPQTTVARPPIDQDALERLAQVERIIAAVRIAVVGSIGLWLGLRPDDTTYPVLAWCALAVAGVYSSAVIVWRRWFYGTCHGSWLLTSADAALTLIVIAATGAARSPAVAILFLVAITAAMRFDIRRALILSIVDSAAYATVALFVPRPAVVAGERAEAALWWSFYLVSTAVLTGVLSRLAQHEHDLRRRAENISVLARQRAAHMEALEQEREQTLRVVVHEFRTPIASLRALARQLSGTRGTANPASGQDRATRLIQDHADHLADMCEAVREAISGQGLEAFDRGVPCDVAVAAVVRAAVSAAAGTTDVDVDFDPPEAIVMLDPARLRRIVTNLVENAVRHNPADGPPVSVRGRIQDATLTLRITDHGPGMSGDSIDLARSKGVRFAPASGSQGLGLWMVDRLVGNMGGSLDIHSQPGAGLQVVVSLPVQPG